MNYVSKDNATALMQGIGDKLKYAGKYKVTQEIGTVDSTNLQDFFDLLDDTLDTGILIGINSVVLDSQKNVFCKLYRATDTSPYFEQIPTSDVATPSQWSGVFTIVGRNQSAKPKMLVGDSFEYQPIRLYHKELMPWGDAMISAVMTFDSPLKMYLNQPYPVTAGQEWVYSPAFPGGSSQFTDPSGFLFNIEKSYMNIDATASDVSISMNLSSTFDGAPRQDVILGKCTGTYGTDIIPDGFGVAGLYSDDALTTPLPTPMMSLANGHFSLSGITKWTPMGDA